VISQTAEYALRAVVYLASDPDTPKTTRQIAEVTRVPVSYLAKVLQSLSRAELITSQRGLHGGSLLAKPPSHLTVFEVINAVEPVQRIRSCPLGLKSHGVRLCPLHRRLDNAMAMMEEALRATTIAEILAEPTASVPLCDMVVEFHPTKP
jgi:Rrf2 family protein